MFENESDIVRQDIQVLQRMLDHDELEANGGDLFKIEWTLNTALDHIEFLKRNMPYDHMSDDVEDEVVECEKLIAQATELLAAVREHYLPSELAAPTPAAATPKAKPVQKKRYINWSNVILIGIIIAIIAYIFINDAV